MISVSLNGIEYYTTMMLNGLIFISRMESKIWRLIVTFMFSCNLPTKFCSTFGNTTLNVEKKLQCFNWKFGNIKFVQLLGYLIYWRIYYPQASNMMNNEWFIGLWKLWYCGNYQIYELFDKPFKVISYIGKLFDRKKQCKKCNSNSTDYLKR